MAQKLTFLKNFNSFRKGDVRVLPDTVANVIVKIGAAVPYVANDDDKTVYTTRMMNANDMPERRTRGRGRPRAVVVEVDGKDMQMSEVVASGTEAAPSVDLLSMAELSGEVVTDKEKTLEIVDTSIIAEPVDGNENVTSEIINEVKD